KEFDLKILNSSKLDDYTVIIKVLEEEDQLLKINERIPAGEKFLKEVLDAKNLLIEQLNTTKESLKLNKNSLPDLSILSDIKAWFVKYNHENELLRQQNTALEAKQEELQSLKEKIQTLIKNPLFSNDKIESLNDVKEVIKQHQLKLDQEEKEYRDLLT